MAVRRTVVRGTVACLATTETYRCNAIDSKARTMAPTQAPRRPILATPVECPRRTGDVGNGGR